MCKVVPPRDIVSGRLLSYSLVLGFPHTVTGQVCPLFELDSLHESSQEVKSELTGAISTYRSGLTPEEMAWDDNVLKKHSFQRLPKYAYFGVWADLTKSVTTRSRPRERVRT